VTFAQETQEREKPGDTGKTMTITGCLQKGGATGPYSIKDMDGKEYELQSTSVKLENHVNHKVTVTGNMMQSDKGNDNQKDDNQKEEHPMVNVTDVKMVSSTCNK
jgi:hypothetical protein